MSHLTEDDIPPDLRDEAVAWLVRVESDRATAEDFARLTAWLELSPLHARAFNEAHALSADLDGSADLIRAELSRDAAKVVPLQRRRRPPPGLPGFALRAASLAAAVVLGGLLFFRAYPGPAHTFVTARGETREVALADGSRLDLDADTRLSVRMGWTQRRVDLAEGEARFDVSKDPGRPFLVGLGGQTVRVVGTEFNIRRYDRQTVITVRRGVVAVYDGPAAGRPIARLTPGWRLVHMEGQPGSTISQVDPAIAFAWTQGQLICEDQPLSEVVAYLNRRFPVPIHLSEDAAKRRFSGVLALHSQQEAARDLAQYLALSEEEAGGAILLR